MTRVEEKYHRRIGRYGGRFELYNKKAGALGNYKLLLFFSGIAAAFLLYFMNQFILMAAQLVLFTVLFVVLARLQNKLIRYRDYAGSMLKINQMCHKRVLGQWPEFGDTGSEFQDPQHSFSFDLDIFGENSLFQMLNMTSTYTGRNKLAGMLANPLREKEKILERQAAITELSGKLLFRQRLLSKALMRNKNVVLPGDGKKNKKSEVTLTDTIGQLDDIFRWAEEENSFYRSSKFKIMITALPLLSNLLLLLSAVGLVSPLLPILLYALQFLMLGYKINYRNKSFEIVETYSKTLKTYSDVLKQIEREKFESPLMRRLKDSLKGDSNQLASQQIEKLSKLWELIANRYNFLHIVINAATLWDFHCIAALEKWKMNSGRFLHQWFELIGEIEALCSMSVLCHDNPQYTMPEVGGNDRSGIVGEKLGHPLLTGRRECNDIFIDSQNPILLITGSNMSGKSTFLRTVGLSLVLAYMGMPVCAEKFKCPILKVHACMRTSDNLGQSVSSFYAELLRVKMIVEAVDNSDRVFFLLDEIFKGTNSADRHTGAKMLIKQLDKKHAWGLVSTHDLELAIMEKESGGRIQNYHFKEYYRDDRIHFDYKLRKGVSDTRNAIYLMKMAGVTVE